MEGTFWWEAWELLSMSRMRFTYTRIQPQHQYNDLAELGTVCVERCSTASWFVHLGSAGLLQSEPVQQG